MSIDSAMRRGLELRESGLTSLRAFRVLKREFPTQENDVLWRAVGEGLTGVTPMWAERSSPREAFYREDPRG